jgi:hypothetical protein
VRGALLLAILLLSAGAGRAAQASAPPTASPASPAVPAAAPAPPAPAAAYPFPVPPGWSVRADPTGRIRLVFPWDAAVLAAPLEADAVAFDARLRALLGTQAAGPFTIYLAPGPPAQAALGAFLPAGPEWASGYAFRGSGIAVLRGDPRRGPLQIGFVPVLRHELVHLVLNEALGTRAGEPPVWFSEGTASFLAHEGGLRDLAVLARTALSQRYIPLRDLTDSFPAGRGEADAAYVESYAFVARMVELHGPGSLARIVGGMRAGAAFDEAFRAVAGRSVAGEEALWRRSFLWRYRWIPVLTSGTTLWIAVTLLFLFAGWRRRRHAREVMARWEEEERRRGPADATWEAADQDGGEARRRLQEDLRRVEEELRREVDRLVDDDGPVM